MSRIEASQDMGLCGPYCFWNGEVSRASFVVPLKLGEVQVTVSGFKDKRLGQIIEDTLHEMSRVPLEKIVNLEGADYKVKKRRKIK